MVGEVKSWASFLMENGNMPEREDCLWCISFEEILISKDVLGLGLSFLVRTRTAKINMPSSKSVIEHNCWQRMTKILSCEFAWFISGTWALASHTMSTCHTNLLNSELLKLLYAKLLLFVHVLRCLLGWGLRLRSHMLWLLIPWLLSPSVSHLLWKFYFWCANSLIWSRLLGICNNIIFCDFFWGNVFWEILVYWRDLKWFFNEYSW